MSKTIVLRYRTRAEATDENQRPVEACSPSWPPRIPPVFKQLNEARPRAAREQNSHE
jgi:hypothetical protein